MDSEPSELGDLDSAGREIEEKGERRMGIKNTKKKKSSGGAGTSGSSRSSGSSPPRTARTVQDDAVQRIFQALGAAGIRIEVPDEVMIREAAKLILDYVLENHGRAGIAKVVREDQETIQRMSLDELAEKYGERLNITLKLVMGKDLQDLIDDFKKSQWGIRFAGELGDRSSRENPDPANSDSEDSADSADSAVIAAITAARLSTEEEFNATRDGIRSQMNSVIWKWGHRDIDWDSIFGFRVQGVPGRRITQLWRILLDDEELERVPENELGMYPFRKLPGAEGMIRVLKEIGGKKGRELAELAEREERDGSESRELRCATRLVGWIEDRETEELELPVGFVTGYNSNSIELDMLHELYHGMTMPGERVIEAWRYPGEIEWRGWRQPSRRGEEERGSVRWKEERDFAERLSRAIREFHGDSGKGGGKKFNPPEEFKKEFGH